MSKNYSLFFRSAILSVFLTTSSFTNNVHADRIVYSYDEAGNRVQSEKEIILRSIGRTTDIKIYNDSLSQARIIIYPNPTQGDLKIDIVGIDNFDHTELKVISLNSVVITSVNQLSASNEVDLTNYPNGTYLLIIRLNDDTTTWKIIKE